MMERRTEEGLGGMVWLGPSGEGEVVREEIGGGPHCGALVLEILGDFSD